MVLEVVEVVVPVVVVGRLVVSVVVIVAVVGRPVVSVVVEFL